MAGVYFEASFPGMIKIKLISNGIASDPVLELYCLNHLNHFIIQGVAVLLKGMTKRDVPALMMGDGMKREIVSFF